ncbi:hypothetical protein JCM24511_01620 [Saitozyma sp. JCM 24511]|nr:hypothetical protein JCM24511_01620 [Saitozyma sp. JCM 24511]
MWRTRPFIRVLLTTLSAACLLLVLNPSPPLPFLDLVNTIGDYVPNLPGTPTPGLTSVRVAVFEQNAFHDEVIGAVLTVLTDLKTNVTLYRGGLNNGYGEVISDIWDVKEQKPTPIDKLATHIDEGRFDVLVLVSCDSKFMHHHQALRKSFAARQDLHVICLLHEVENFVKENEEQRGMMAVPAEQGRLTFVELSEHGASKVQAVVEGWSTDADQWEVDVVDFAPIFPLTGIPMRTDLSIPSRAAILGRMNPHSRAYDRIISELYESLLSKSICYSIHICSLARTPEIWGYRLETVPPGLSAEGTQSSPSGIARPKFTPLDDPANPPFTLHLIGNDEGRLSIPEELLESEGGADPIVAIHSQGKYVEFYSDIAAMLKLQDLVLPAFMEDMYTEYRASAAIPAAIVSRYSRGTLHCTNPLRGRRGRNALR